MAATLLPNGIPPLERPSPAPSDNSIFSQPECPPERLTRSRGRANRVANIANLRTNFRNFSSIATLIVGEPDSKTRPETKYYVHKDLLASASPFFAAALNGNFTESQDQTVRLPEEKPEIFEWFLQWLYTGTLKTPTPNCHAPAMLYQAYFNDLAIISAHTQTNGSHHPALRASLADHDIRTDGDLRNHQGSPKYFLLLDLYALSDRILTTQLSNHILSTIARLSESTNSVPTPSDTWILYEGGGIRDNAPIRTLILDLFAYKKTDRLLGTHKDEWHPRFLRELCVKLKRPGPEAIERHSLIAWRPSDWSNSCACEICRRVVAPGVSGDRCRMCDKVFCGYCLRSSVWVGARGSGLMDTGGCKPWNGAGLCARYHEHDEEVGPQRDGRREDVVGGWMEGVRLQGR